MRARLGLVAQLVERRTSKPKVAGSAAVKWSFSLLTRYGFDSLGSCINISLYICICITIIHQSGGEWWWIFTGPQGGKVNIYTINLH